MLQLAGVGPVNRGAPVPDGPPLNQPPPPAGNVAGKNFNFTPLQ